jgi:pimeloyl-ACP methyl ester carboxylesterase
MVQMAKNALELIDHLRWAQCHVVGISMDGMITLELSLLARGRILSLTLTVRHADGLASQAPFIGLRHIFRSLKIRDQDGLVNNAVDMLYGPKTLSNPDKRQPSRHAWSLILYFLFNHI